jgi:hypothetical protein
LFCGIPFELSEPPAPEEEPLDPEELPDPGELPDPEEPLDPEELLEPAPAPDPEPLLGWEAGAFALPDSLALPDPPDELPQPAAAKAVRPNASATRTVAIFCLGGNRVDKTMLLSAPEGTEVGLLLGKSVAARKDRRQAGRVLPKLPLAFCACQSSERARRHGSGDALR